MGIYGVGRNRAVQFLMQGFINLEDLLERGKLTEAQRTGVLLYDV
jgi:Fingers domain of DNA polymerase lambda